MKNILIVGAVLVLVVGGVVLVRVSNTKPVSESSRVESTSSPEVPVSTTQDTPTTSTPVATTPTTVAPTEPSTPTATTPTTTNGTYTLAEVAKHNTATNCWIAVNGTVLDVTKFIASGQHNPEIIKGCGIDATSLFAAVRKHAGREAQSLFTTYTIGTLKS